ncbi:hypothetical protein RF11_07437 [Thelohanellus kitauei]|uniref:Uncharacterized protein n=1 Tax=Thelohanellus kitauei TaxID=669202 RepID=A0A0C2NEX9_THEKT|nr:hypothetical protein RF11_07437 [Thelohanellus kitauei]
MTDCPEVLGRSFYTAPYLPTYPRREMMLYLKGYPDEDAARGMASYSQHTAKDILSPYDDKDDEDYEEYEDATKELATFLSNRAGGPPTSNIDASGVLGNPETGLVSTIGSAESLGDRPVLHKSYDIDRNDQESFHSAADLDSAASSVVPPIPPRRNNLGQNRQPFDDPPINQGSSGAITGPPLPARAHRPSGDQPHATATTDSASVWFGGNIPTQQIRTLGSDEIDGRAYLIQFNSQETGSGDDVYLDPRILDAMLMHRSLSAPESVN